MPSTFVELVRPFARLVPIVKKPERSPSFKLRFLYTVLGVLIYLLLMSIPIWGIDVSQGYDIFWSLRVILASSRGTLAELGIGPIVTGGLILEILAGSKMINIDLSDPQDRRAFNEAMRGMAVIMILFESLVYISGGAYGYLPASKAFAVFMQLVLASALILMLDETLRHYGIGSGISLFILAGVAQQIFWALFWPYAASDGLPIGFISALVTVLYGSGRIEELLLRWNSPDLIGLVVTIFIFMLIVYLENVRIDIPVEHVRLKYRVTYPIKLMYSSNIPVILTGALFANIMLFSQILWSRFPGNFFVGLLGSWTVQETSQGGRPVPVGGLARFTVAPQSLLASLHEPVRALGYTLIMILSCWMFAVMWVDVAGLDPKNIARQLLSSELKIPGIRANINEIADYIRPYIYTSASLSGVLIGLIAAIADCLGAFATGPGLLLATSISIGIYQEIARRYLEEVPGAFRKFLFGRGF
ncbi:MAG: preprotein translocase subunit SecY [Candidatus Korarchaeota archaeon]|nr:preprotein translocase subunit SecY [Thermoproteota archaeon]MCR8454743.1 preprotein translocase subunit SecY [Thermoproteota archaeon]MCR8463417.1 preprotein translocase subunit SecY [Thermoproteota archaeon]MCR8470254.1 preprotein translocase subunit SecY [Thermoproteota archaeon]MCR8472181.1 preprotein translocase subunit SecY [Thermoproteota archaeon]